MTLWRISNFATLDGLGGMKFSARWHNKGRPIVYAADHPASALVEMLAHTELSLLPDSFQLLKISAPKTLKIPEARPPKKWRDDPAITRSIGDRWLAQNASALLQVPSAILPHVYHTLINPLHKDAAKLKIVSVERVPLDERLAI